MAAALMFYLQATETKECPNYAYTKVIAGIDKMKEACEELNGVIASEDLKDSGNVLKAKLAYDELRDEDENVFVFIGVTVRDAGETPDKVANPFVFSDDTEFKDGDFLKWAESTIPEYADIYRCSILKNSNGKMSDVSCDQSGRALCYVDCPTSGFELSRANLPLFALFLAAHVF